MLGKRVKCKDCGNVFLAEQTAPEGPEPSADPPPEEGIEFLAAAVTTPSTAPASYKPRTIEPRKGEKSTFIDFLAFRRMITPIIIQILFWVDVVLCVVWGAVYIGKGVAAQGEFQRQIQGRVFLTEGSAGSYYAWVGVGDVLVGVAIIIFGPIVVRVCYEILILFFRMNETLTDIRNNTEKP
jgi:hypothetical protein